MSCNTKGCIDPPVEGVKQCSFHKELACLGNKISRTKKAGAIEDHARGVDERNELKRERREETARSSPRSSPDAQTTTVAAATAAASKCKPRKRKSKVARTSPKPFMPTCTDDENRQTGQSLDHQHTKSSSNSTTISQSSSLEIESKTTHLVGQEVHFRRDLGRGVIEVITERYECSRSTTWRLREESVIALQAMVQQEEMRNISSTSDRIASALYSNGSPEMQLLLNNIADSICPPQEIKEPEGQQLIDPAWPAGLRSRWAVENRIRHKEMIAFDSHDGDRRRMHDELNYFLKDLSDGVSLGAMASQNCRFARRLLELQTLPVNDLVRYTELDFCQTESPTIVMLDVTNATQPGSRVGWAAHDFAAFDLTKFPKKPPPARVCAVAEKNLQCGNPPIVLQTEMQAEMLSLSPLSQHEAMGALRSFAISAANHLSNDAVGYAKHVVQEALKFWGSASVLFLQYRESGLALAPGCPLVGLLNEADPEWSVKAGEELLGLEVGVGFG
jgi:hypothetical protein